MALGFLGWVTVNICAVCESLSPFKFRETCYSLNNFWKFCKAWLFNWSRFFPVWEACEEIVVPNARQCAVSLDDINKLSMDHKDILINICFL